MNATILQSINSVITRHPQEADGFATAIDAEIRRRGEHPDAWVFAAPPVCHARWSPTHWADYILGYGRRIPLETVIQRRVEKALTGAVVNFVDSPRKWVTVEGLKLSLSNLETLQGLFSQVQVSISGEGFSFPTGDNFTL
jgi:hypothetical protein